MESRKESASDSGWEPIGGSRMVSMEARLACPNGAGMNSMEAWLAFPNGAGLEPIEGSGLDSIEARRESP